MKMISALALTASLSIASSTFAAAPQFSGTWVNSSPMKTEALQGKVVVLYYYEEGCPSCRAKWPGLIEVSEQFKDEPVVFIAVNSGNEAKEVENYLSSVNCKWAGLADTDRSFEKASGVGEISLRNIYQAKIITPRGTMVNANPASLATDVKANLSGASWKVDPKIVPESMKPAWKALEFGDYAAATSTVKKTIKAKDEKTRTAAEAMDKAINTDLDALMAGAAEDEKAGNKWEAYKKYERAAANFKGYPKATEATAAVKKLATDKDLKDEIKAWAMFDRAQKALASRNRQEQRSGEGMLDSIVKQYPATEAGMAAEKMIKNRPTAE